VRTVRAVAEIPLEPRDALALWSDCERWGAFVEGFERVVERDPRWPAKGATVVWESIPQGRGRVTERVVEWDPERRLDTEVVEEPLGGGAARLSGRQALTLERADAREPAARAPARRAGADAPGGGAASQAELALEYELARRAGVFERLTDVLFVRRALAAALDRTLARFGTEAGIEGQIPAESAR
jgi:hypothetical protein